MKYFAITQVLIALAGRSKNDYSHFELILCCFWAKISPHTKFHRNWLKNTEFGNFCYKSIFVGQVGRSKNGRSHPGHSFSNWRDINDLCSKFEPNRMKIGKVSPSGNFFPKIKIWLIRPVCKKMVVAAPNFPCLIFLSKYAPKQNFTKIGRKM